MATDMIGFIGAGQMARALARGLVSAGLVQVENLCASDPVAEARTAFQEMVPGARVSTENREIVSAASTIVLAIKPQQMEAVLDEIAEALDDSKLLISIAAGVRLSQIGDQLAPGVRLIRVMPNTPCLVGEGASGYALGIHATVADAQFVDRMLRSVGQTFPLEEELLDAVTALSGSGPAFFSAVLAALSDGGCRMGLPAEVAGGLALQTMLGTATYLQSTGETPELLKKRVSSPGGTTLAGLAALESHHLHEALVAAVEAATRRSRELGSGE